MRTSSPLFASFALLAAYLAAAQKECVESFQYDPVTINPGSSEYVDVTGTFDTNGEWKEPRIRAGCVVEMAELHHY